MEGSSNVASGLRESLTGVDIGGEEPRLTEVKADTVAGGVPRSQVIHVERMSQAGRLDENIEEKDGQDDDHEAEADLMDQID